MADLPTPLDDGHEWLRDVEAPEVELRGKISGFCLVQGVGTVAGRAFYFRARWQHWWFRVTERHEIRESIRPDGRREFVLDEGQTFFSRHADWGASQYEASWMPLVEAERVIRVCVAEYLATAER